MFVAACSTTATPNYDLDVTLAGDGSGSVTSSPAGIDTAAGDDAATFEANTVVTLTASPAAGSSFVGFSFADGTTCEAGSGATTCIVTLDDDVAITATL